MTAIIYNFVRSDESSVRMTKLNGFSRLWDGTPSPNSSNSSMSGRSQAYFDLMRGLFGLSRRARLILRSSSRRRPPDHYGHDRSRRQVRPYPQDFRAGKAHQRDCALAHATPIVVTRFASNQRSGDWLCWRGRLTHSMSWWGPRFRIFRTHRGMSQSDLAGKIGVAFQQVQKYEKGINRVGASRLSRIAAVLGVSIGELFEPSGNKRSNSKSPFRLLAERGCIAGSHGLFANQRSARAACHRPLVETIADLRPAAKSAAARPWRSSGSRHGGARRGRKGLSWQ